MKQISSILFLALFLTSCGDGDSTTFESQNLFLKAENQKVTDNPSDSLLGLWESEDFITPEKVVVRDDETERIEEVTHTIRWEITESKTTLAKRCIINGRKFYAQVSINFDSELVKQSAEITPYDMPMDSNVKVSKVTLMSNNQFCSVAMDSSQASLSLVASDTTEYELTDDNFQSGEMTLSTLDSGNVQLIKIQNQ